MVDKKRRETTRREAGDPEFADFARMYIQHQKYRHGEGEIREDILSNIIDYINKIKQLFQKRWSETEDKSAVNYAFHVSDYHELLIKEISSNVILPLWPNDWIHLAFGEFFDGDVALDILTRGSFEDLLLISKIITLVPHIDYLYTFRPLDDFSLNNFCNQYLMWYLEHKNEWIDGFFRHQEEFLHAFLNVLHGQFFYDSHAYNTSDLVGPEYEQFLHIFKSQSRLANIYGIRIDAEQIFNIIRDHHSELLAGSTNTEIILNAIPARSAQELSKLIMAYRYLSGFEYEAFGHYSLGNSPSEDRYYIKNAEDDVVVYGYLFPVYKLAPYGEFNLHGEFLDSTHVTQSGYGFSISENVNTGETWVRGNNLKVSSAFAPWAIDAIRSLDIENLYLEHDWIDPEIAADRDEYYYDLQEDLEK